jgi:hypothetical protein
MLCALTLGFTCNLSQIARQLTREGSASIRRQFLARWLNEPAWDPEVLYAGLHRRARRLLASKRQVALLVDYTFLGNEWAVLQVSVGWQRRALPLYRGVLHRCETGQSALVKKALCWLAGQLPGPRSRYVLVMDRGFPSHALITWLSEQRWNFVLRVSAKWKMTHPRFTGLLREAQERSDLVGATARHFQGGMLGRLRKGPDEVSGANLVTYSGEGCAEPWLLVTSLQRADPVVALYRQRMQIEQEFRDLKGPLGLDRLESWHSKERVARFLAWVALYEWWLAHLWEVHRLAAWGMELVVHGSLSWIRITREWLRLHAYQPTRPALARL